MLCLPLIYHANNADLFQSIRHWPYPLWLDSCHDQGTQGRYDILTAQPENYFSSSIAPDNLTEIINKHLLIHYKVYFSHQAELDSAIPMPGLFGYLSYEANHSAEKIDVHKDKNITLPILFLGFYPWCIVVDHQQQKTWLASLLNQDITQEIFKQITNANISSQLDHEIPFCITEQYQSNLTQNEYFSAFHKIQNYLYQGDCYQVNFAQRFQASYQGDPFIAYQRNRKVMPAPYSAFLQLPEGCILCHSPEHFIRVNDQCVETSPIKGTAAKQMNEQADQLAQQQLLDSEKNHAENLMIVDLLRNDLGKVCEIGSVQVETLCELKTFSHVHHLISTITGKLARNISPLDLLQACFPGGSITGAPKHRAMEIINELEPHRRSIYCGSMIHLGINHRLDSNIMIRTQVTHEGKIYAWAGGGIVADSQAEEEYEESFVKVRPLLI